MNSGGRPRGRQYEPGEPGEPVILRVRMRRRLLNRLKAVIEHDRERLQEAWNLSDGCREVLMEWVERREGEIRRAAAGGFSGLPPDRTRPGLNEAEPDDEADDVIAAKN